MKGNQENVFRHLGKGEKRGSEKNIPMTGTRICLHIEGLDVDTSFYKN